ncbi:MAG: hypothetical protein ABI967_03765 [bacterium]
MKKSLLLVVLSLVLSSVSLVVAQEGPPKVLLIVREEIKPGMMDDHNRHSAEFASIFSQLQTPNHRLAMVPVAGSENEVLYVTGAESFGELEGIMQATDKKMSDPNPSVKAQMARLQNEAPGMHNGMRDMMAIYRPDLSFNPGVPVATMRYFSITTVRVRPGHDAQFTETTQKVINPARQKAKVDGLHVAVYQIISGAPGGTYMAFRLLKSLAEFDSGIAAKVRAAMTDDQKKEADKSVSDAIMSSEASTYMLMPKMSYVDSAMAAGDPEFWHPKMEMAAKPKPRKRTPKPAAPAPPPQ